MKQIRIAEKTERNQTVSWHLFQVSQISLYFSLFFKSHTNPLRCLAAILPVKLESVRRRMSAISGHDELLQLKSLQMRRNKKAGILKSLLEKFPGFASHPEFF